MFTYIRRNEHTAIKFTDGAAMCKLFEMNREAIETFYNRKYKLTHKLIARLAISSLTVNSVEHFKKLVETFETHRDQYLNHTPTMNRVRINGQDYHDLYTIRVTILEDYGFSIAVPNLFKLAMINLLSKKREEVNSLLTSLEAI